MNGSGDAGDSLFRCVFPLWVDAALLVAAETDADGIGLGETVAASVWAVGSVVWGARPRSGPEKDALSSSSLEQLLAVGYSWTTYKRRESIRGRYQSIV